MEGEAPAQSQEVERALGPPRDRVRSRIPFVLDAIAYLLAVAGIFPAGGALFLWIMVVTRYEMEPRGPFDTWRRAIFAFFAQRAWVEFLIASAASAALAGAAIAISRRRRKSSRLAAASVRLATLGLVLAAIGAAFLGGLAAYQDWY